MQQPSRAPKKEDLKRFQPFGIPLLKMLFGLVLISLLVTALYEFLF